MATHPSFSQFTADLHPQVPADRTVSGEHWRISLITDSLVRLEWSDDGVFEDRPTQVVLNRDLGGDLHADIRRTGDGVRIETPALLLDYDGRPFSKEGLSIVVKGVPGSQFNTWHYGERGGGNLLGTARTLDEVDGETALGDGVLSRDGWAVLDDSTSNVLADVATVGGEENLFGSWPTARADDPGRVDLYVFAYGLRFLEAIRDWHRLTGPTPLLPRWALGNWWSRFTRYDQDGYLELMDRFRAEKLPFTVAVIDMDWHLTDVDPKYGSGWTGYTWNRELFPDPARLLADLHERGMRVTLNEHPRDGIRAFEEEYPAVARDMGIDPDSGDPVAFDPSSPRFLDAYLAMHHRMAADGVDFWWVDWQQGGVTRQRGLDPLWMLNHAHYLDSLDEAQAGRTAWPMTFSRFAGPGSHRYPIGFSGDTIVSWRSLEFQPRFTATAANIGYDWWSHDIGGHMLGVRDDELEVRWYQFGAFSPINRLHSSSSPFAGKEPWNFPEPARHAMEEALRLRQRLLPYLYTMNYRTARQARPLVEPMYWQDPGIGEAYQYPDEYRFGSELVAAPAVRPCDPMSRLARTDLWLPQGEWFDFFDGRRYAAPRPGGRRLAAWRGIGRIPVFAKAGGIVPLQTLDGPDALNSTDNPQALEVLAFAGADGSFTLHEDDGDWAQVSRGRVALTDLRQEWGDGMVAFTVDAVRGDDAAVPETRDWTVSFRGVGGAVGDVAATVDGVPAESATHCDAATLTLSVTVRGVPRSSVLRVEVPGLRVADDPAVEDCRRVLLDAQMPNLTKDIAFSMVAEQGAAALPGLRALDTQAGAPHADLAESHMPGSVLAALEEILLRSAACPNAGKPYKQ